VVLVPVGVVSVTGETPTTPARRPIPPESPISAVALNQMFPFVSAASA